jgi:hypothetical protein
MSSLTNPASCARIVFGVISHLNRSWQKKPLKEFTQRPGRYPSSSELEAMEQPVYDFGQR